MHQSLKTGLMTAIATLFSFCLHAQNDSTYTFTDEHPLVYVDAWDLWPYAFLDENGHPQGYNIELVTMLMDELKLPYVIRLKERREALEDLKKGKAHMTLGIEMPFHDEFGHYGQSVVQLFTHSLMVPQGQPMKLQHLNDLATNKVIVHAGSFSHHLMIQHGWGDNAVPYDDMKTAVQECSDSGSGIILWNTASLKWLMHMMQTTNMQLVPADVPHGEYKFMSRSTQLLNQLDSAYAIVNESNRLEEAQNRWFYPEQVDSGIPSWVWNLAGIGILLVLVLIIYNVSYRHREHQINAQLQRRNRRLAAILHTSHVRIWIYDVATQMFSRLDPDGKTMLQSTALEFARRFRPEDFDQLADGLRQVANQECDTVTLELHGNGEVNEDGDDREYVICLSVLRREKGKPTVIIGTKSDVTDERRKQRQAKTRLLRYQSVFNTGMVDMVYYNEKGDITNMNERAQNTFQMKLSDTVKERVNVRTAIEDPNLVLDEFETYHATQFLNTAGENRNIKSRKLKTRMYYELQLVPVFDKQHHLLCIYGTGRDVTEVADAYHQVLRGVKEIQKATEEVTEYVQNINYVLGVGGVRIATYSPDTHTLTIYKGMNVVQLALTQSRCMTLVDDASKKRAMRLLNSMDNRTTSGIEADIKTTLQLKGRELHLQFRFIPVRDANGKVQEYFGLCRDMSLIKEKEQLLEKETARAQEVENLKNSFLRNMSYEIRTPLNAVVGFAELFEHEHSAEDEVVFIQQIKDNSAHLLHLINDILFLSRLDARMIEMNTQPVDFAKTFEAYCQMGWAHEQKPGVNYVVENHYDELVVELDDTNLSRVIEQITANAAQHTDSGTVRTRYDYISNRLVIAVEDTGCGISEETMKHIYERFTSDSNKTGTGLGLPIAKELIEQMGGTIDISSEPGKGTTVWIALPCTATVINRKKEI